MTAANDTQFQTANRRLNRLLAFLSLFFLTIAGVAAAHRLHILGAGQSQTVFDSKGILTGPGTLLVLLAAALAALILFVVYKKWALAHLGDDVAEISKLDEKIKCALSDWLAQDVLGAGSYSDVSAAQIDGRFQGRNVTIERITSGDQAIERYVIDAQSELSMRIWWLGKWQKKSESGSSQSAPASEHATHDPRFEACCAWESGAPAEALKFLNKGDVTGTLHRLCFLSGEQSGAPEETGIVFESGRIVLTARVPTRSLIRAPSTLVFLQDLAFLANAAENKAAPQLLSGAGAQPTDNGVERILESPPSCGLLIVFVLIPLAALWIGGSYYCAKVLDMSAGMLCFFVPVLLMAIFVFTRPSESGGGAGFKEDLETVRAAALKYWEQRLRDDPSYAALLDKYERRAQ